jgi:hypothetical protein
MTGDTEETELIVIAESEAAGNHIFAVNSYIVETSVDNAVIHSVSGLTGFFWGSPFPQWTRLNESGTTDYTGIFPVLVFPSIVPTDSQGQNGHMYVYPDVSAPTTFNVEDLIPESPQAGAGAATGQLITYDGRILGLVTPPFTWPGTDSAQFRSNEVIEYTDPPETNQYFPETTDYALLVPENAFGYGAVGSISAGELFLIKRRGGGVLVLGDIDAPSSITYLPGVQPTGNFYGRTDSTSLGLVYCSQGFGAWVWNGANISQKLSPQLEDNFFDATTISGVNSDNLGFFVKRWGNYILFSNGYVYSILTQSWWNLTPPEGSNLPYFHYVDARDDHQFYAMPIRVSTAIDTFLYTFDSRCPAPLYSWTSTDLYRHIASISDRRVDVREVVVVASVNDPTPTGYTITLEVLGANDAVLTTQTSSTPIGQDPSQIRFNIGDKQLGNFKIRLTSTSPNATPGSSTAAPTIWSLDIAYRVRNKQRADQ